MTNSGESPAANCWSIALTDPKSAISLSINAPAAATEVAEIEPEIVAAVILLTKARDVTSESIKAPAAATEVAEREPEIVAAVSPFIRAKDVTSESIKAPALVTLEVFAVSLAVFVATSEATEALREVDEPDIVVAVSPFINAKEVTSESIKAPAEVTLEVFAVSLAVLVATSEATDELKEVDEPDIVAAVRPFIKARDVTSESIKAPAAATEVAEREPEIVAAVNPLIKAKEVTSESIRAPAAVTFDVSVTFA